MTDFFAKENYTQEDIQGLIDSSVEESLYLDFKASGSLAKQDGKKKEISKDVSAFANSDGGIIVYGITEENHVASSLSYIDGSTFTKEWLEHVINSNIQRRVPDLRIHPVRFDNDIVKSVYIVKIPQSLNAPHMASDHKFYKRYNFESVPMEEYEVRVTYNRKQRTKLIIEQPSYRQGSEYSSDGVIQNIDYLLRFQAKNIGSHVEERFKIEVSLPKALHEDYRARKNVIQDHIVREEDQIVVFSVPNEVPIFQNELTTVAEANITIKNLRPASNLKVKTRLYYSNGYEEEEFDLADILKYKNKPIREGKWF
ncbi:MAG: ATP-binding protein [Bacteroidota bacterium]